MRKIFLTVLACLLLVTSSAHAEFLKDAEGFSYFNSYNYLIFSSGNKFCSAYDLSSIHIIANNNARFEFNVIVLAYSYVNGSISNRTIANIREDYSTGKIYRNGELVYNSSVWGVSKTQHEIYYKMKSAALSR